MTLTFVTNLVHHHQLPIADEFYRMLGDDYHYIATEPLPDWLIRGGYDPTLDRPYIIRTYQSEEAMSIARMLIDESDVVIMGHSPMEWGKKRKTEGKVTFYAAERPYKRGLSWLRYLKAVIANYKNYGRYKRTYMLCASAYTASDYARTYCFKDKCFKWGYFTKVDTDFDVEANQEGGSTSEITPLMWCARFLKWKHPELPILLAQRLKSKGYKFTIDMFGSGEEFENTQKLITELGVDDCVNLCGNRPNEVILQEMRKHKIFLFTSDQNEGWGAVLNEAMANGCVPVVSDTIGSALYLIKDGRNGFLFRSCDIDSLEEKVIRILDNPQLQLELSQKAVETMQKKWSPRNAAENFLKLASHALNNTLEKYTLTEGPASWDNKNIG
ncbi:MAG: glycosyltransferase [Marinilabiliaceae bacterium]|nr:glycosyltransferase [Marinilabiliaceae bacterium]